MSSSRSAARSSSRRRTALRPDRRRDRPDGRTIPNLHDGDHDIGGDPLTLDLKPATGALAAIAVTVTVTDDQLTLPTPCEKATVADLLDASMCVKIF
jgi:hypothetical protein